MESLSKPHHDTKLHDHLTKTPSILPIQYNDHVLKTLFDLLKFPTFLLVLVFSHICLIYKWMTQPIINIYNFFLFVFSSSLFFFFNFKQFLWNTKPPPIYLVDFACLKPPNFCRVPFSTFIEHAFMLDCFNTESLCFMSKIITSSGQGQNTYLPPPLHYIPPKTSHQDAIDEAKMLLFPVMEDLLTKTKISPLDIDILIVNCSGFSPSPSLTSILINKYSMKPDIKSFNISGMGCSAGAIGISIAQSLLKINKNKYAIVMGSEILSNAWYSGNEKPKLPLNCLFRMGCAGVLLTNKREEKNRAKYKLSKMVVRTTRAFDNKAYLCVIREEDSKGITGVTIDRDKIQAVSEILKSHVTSLGATILPFKEKIRYVLSAIFGNKDVYVPDFTSVIQHFCLPTTGKSVIREIGKGLRLSGREMEAALMCLHRFGNQSSSSMWYELSYLEAKERVKKGDKVWQLCMGAGPKCNSVVWECLRNIVNESKTGPWLDCIHQYPVIIDRYLS